jgi:hypothetical protein
MVETRVTMRVRGVLKTILLAAIANDVLTTIFDYAAARLDPDVGRATTVFSLVSGVLAVIWLQADARRAYQAALKSGFVLAVATSWSLPI